MKSGGVRFCDVCEAEIPSGEKFRRVLCRPEATMMFRAADDPDIRPTWTENPDGTVTLEICLDCVMGMGKALPENERH